MFSVKKLFLKISQKSQKNIYTRISLLIKLLLQTLAHVFSCEFCEIFKNIFFEEHLRPTPSELFWKFVPPDKYTYEYVSGGKYARFSENLTCFVYLKHPF